MKNRILVFGLIVAGSQFSLAMTVEKTETTYELYVTKYSNKENKYFQGKATLTKQIKTSGKVKDLDAEVSDKHSIDIKFDSEEDQNTQNPVKIALKNLIQTCPTVKIINDNLKNFYLRSTEYQIKFDTKKNVKSAFIWNVASSFIDDNHQLLTDETTLKDARGVIDALDNALPLIIEVIKKKELADDVDRWL